MRKIEDSVEKLRHVLNERRKKDMDKQINTDK
jgi:hypothetical protein